MTDLVTLQMMEMMSPLTSSPELHDGGSQNTTLDTSGDVNNTNVTQELVPSVLIPCDNPRNVISPEVAEMVDLVVYVGIFPALVTWGVITNIINMAVFVRQGLSDRVHLCLFSLAVSDTGFLLFLMCGKSYAVISLVDPVAGNYWLMRHNGAVLGNYLGFVSISNTITTIIAVDRCCCVLNPLKAATFIKTKYIAVMIVTVGVTFLAVENVTLSIKYQTLQITDPLTNTSTYISRLSPFYLKNRLFMDLLDLYLVSIIPPFCSLFIITFCTITIIVRLRAAANWRRKTMSNMTSVEKKDILLTRMLLTVCCFYLTCMIPSVTRAMVLVSRLPGFLITGHLCNVFKVSISFTLLLEASNASINFLIYVNQSSQYRSTLKQMLDREGRQQGRKKDSTTLKLS